MGTALGPHGVAIMDFVKQYNAATESQVGTIIPVEITIFEDRTFTFMLKTPPAPVLLRQKAGLAKGSKEPGKTVVGTVTEADIEEVAKIKMPDLNAYDLEAAKQQIRGTARSMGLKVVAERHVIHHYQPDHTIRLDRDAPRPAALDHEGDRPCQARSSSDSVKPFDRDRFHPHRSASTLAKARRPRRSSTRSIDVAVRLGVDPRKADQMVRGTVALPAGTGKDVRVAVFAAGEAAVEAREAGADLVGADDLAAQIEEGKFDFDVAIATPDMMPLVGRLGRALGPRGLMPNPKTGTVTTDVGRAVPSSRAARSSTAPTATATSTSRWARRASSPPPSRPTSAP